MMMPFFLRRTASLAGSDSLHEHPRFKKRSDLSQIAPHFLGSRLNESLHPVSAEPGVLKQTRDMVVLENEPSSERRIRKDRAVFPKLFEIGKGIVQLLRVVEKKSLPSLSSIFSIMFSEPLESILAHRCTNI
jgi:hypothetical protein